MQMITLAELITRCSLAATPSSEHVNDTLYRVVLATSAGDVHTITDATTGTVRSLNDHEAALELATSLEGIGHDVRMGLAGVHLTRARQMGHDPGRVLDPCTQIGLASVHLEAVLSKASARSDATLHIALATYWSPHDPVDVQAIEWGARVLAITPVDVHALDVLASQGRAREPRVYAVSHGLFLTGGLPKAQKWEALP